MSTVHTDGEASVVQIELHEQPSGAWCASIHGKSAHVLRPVPGNTRPASPARWPSREAALAELPAMLNARIVASHTLWHHRTDENGVKP